MKAIGLTNSAAQTSCVSSTWAVPEPGTGEVRIRVHAVAVNPTTPPSARPARAA